MASSGLWKMLFLIISKTLGVWMLVCPAIVFNTVVNGDCRQRDGYDGDGQRRLHQESRSVKPA